GERQANDVDQEEQLRAPCPAEQRPRTQQHDVIPEHMPVLAPRLPIARSETGCVCLYRQVRPRELLSGDMTHEGDAALEPGIPRVEQQINETHYGRQQDAAFAAVQTLLTRRHGGI